jgi:pimeloyl-ACP methyl ester carboxylesterase
MGVGRFNSPQAHAEFDHVYDAALRVLPAASATHDVPTEFGSVRVYRFGPAEGTPLGEPGRSTQTASLDDGADQAAWLDAVFAALDLRGIHLVGVSFGGWLACNQAVRAPGRLASVSLLDPANTLGRFPPRLLFRSALAALPMVSRWGRPAFQSWVAGGARIPAGDPVAEVIDAGMKHFHMAVPMPRYFTDEQLRSIPIPVLALIAGRSVMHDATAARARAEALIPNVRAEVWPAATHAISAESATEVDKRVLRFVDDEV